MDDLRPVLKEIVGLGQPEVGVWPMGEDLERLQIRIQGETVLPLCAIELGDLNLCPEALFIPLADLKVLL